MQVQGVDLCLDRGHFLHWNATLGFRSIHTCTLHYTRILLSCKPSSCSVAWNTRTQSAERSVALATHSCTEYLSLLPCALLRVVPDASACDLAPLLLVNASAIHSHMYLASVCSRSARLRAQRDRYWQMIS